MPWSALPEHIDEPSEWAGTDFDKPGWRWHNQIKGWFAYGPRAKEWWARWRGVPKVIFALRGAGEWRYESDAELWKGETGIYLSRVQYYCRWHVALQWPLQLSFHWYWHAADVPTAPDRPKDLSMKKLVFGYGPTHRDSDTVYWFPSFFLGGTWK